MQSIEHVALSVISFIVSGSPLTQQHRALDAAVFSSSSGLRAYLEHQQAAVVLPKNPLNAA